jgi:hypothetical protein
MSPRGLLVSWKLSDWCRRPCCCGRGSAKAFDPWQEAILAVDAHVVLPESMPSRVAALLPSIEIC